MDTKGTIIPSGFSNILRIIAFPVILHDAAPPGPPGYLGILSKKSDLWFRFLYKKPNLEADAITGKFEADISEASGLGQCQIPFICFADSEYLSTVMATTVKLAKEIKDTCTKETGIQRLVRVTGRKYDLDTIHKMKHPFIDQGFIPISFCFFVGNVNLKALPFPSSLSAQISPPIFSTNSLQSINPKPEPFSLAVPEVV